MPCGYLQPLNRRDERCAKRAPDRLEFAPQRRSSLRNGRTNRFDSHWLWVEEKMALKVQSHVNQRYHHGHFHQGPYDSRECGSGVDAKYRHRHCNASSKLLEAAVNASVVVFG